MNDTTITLKDFFGLQELKLNEERLAAASRGEATQAVRAAIAKFPGIGWHDIAEGMAGQLAKTFNIGFGELLAGAWCKWRELQEYAEKPETINYLRLAKHTVTSKHEPEVELSLNGSVIATFKCTVTFELEIDGASLTIQDARIKEVRAVSGKGSCKIEYEDYELFKKESETINLPGKVEFDPGIAIPFSKTKTRTTQPIEAQPQFSLR